VTTSEARSALPLHRREWGRGAFATIPPEPAEELDPAVVRAVLGDRRHPLLGFRTSNPWIYSNGTASTIYTPRDPRAFVYVRRKWARRFRPGRSTPHIFVVWQMPEVRLVELVKARAEARGFEVNRVRAWRDGRSVEVYIKPADSSATSSELLEHLLLDRRCLCADLTHLEDLNERVNQIFGVGPRRPPQEKLRLKSPQIQEVESGGL
jgi:hypothetical protein